MKSSSDLSQLDIEDVRHQFRNTFSNYPKAKVLKDLENAIYYQKTEEAFFWTGDLLCSGFVLELWNLYVHVLCKYIHIQHPKLPLYVYKKFVEFKEMVQSCPNDLELRNMDSVKTLLFSMTLILSETKKQTLLDPMTFKFKFEEVFTDLRAPNLEYVVPFFREGDPKEIFIPLNEFVYHLTETKNKTKLFYWMDWILCYDEKCTKEKKPIYSVEREGIPHFYRNIVWVLFEILLSHSDPLRKRSVEALMGLFAIRYRPSHNKKKREILTFCIVLFMEETLPYHLPLVERSDIFAPLQKNIALIFRELKKNEVHVLV
jgi:hypothetical protein